jgi:hypothetical protein
MVSVRMAATVCRSSAPAVASQSTATSEEAATAKMTTKSKARRKPADCSSRGADTRRGRPWEASAAKGRGEATRPQPSARIM